MLPLLNPVDGTFLEVVQLKVELPLHVRDERGKVADVRRVLLGVNVLVDAVFERAGDLRISPLSSRAFFLSAACRRLRWFSSVPCTLMTLLVS